MVESPNIEKQARGSLGEDGLLLRDSQIESQNDLIIVFGPKAGFPFVRSGTGGRPGRRGTEHEFNCTVAQPSQNWEDSRGRGIVIVMMKIDAGGIGGRGQER